MYRVIVQSLKLQTNIALVFGLAEAIGKKPIRFIPLIVS